MGLLHQYLKIDVLILLYLKLYCVPGSLGGGGGCPPFSLPSPSAGLFPPSAAAAVNSNSINDTT